MFAEYRVRMEYTFFSVRSSQSLRSGGQAVGVRPEPERDRRGAKSRSRSDTQTLPLPCTRRTGQRRREPGPRRLVRSVFLIVGRLWGPSSSRTSTRVNCESGLVSWEDKGDGTGPFFPRLRSNPPMPHPHAEATHAGHHRNLCLLGIPGLQPLVKHMFLVIPPHPRPGCLAEDLPDPRRTLV